MRGLQPPPKEETASRVAARMLFLVILVLAAGMVIYTAVTNQRVDLTETTRTAGLELDDPAEVGDLTINVTEDPGGPTPVVLIHDVDVTGGLILTDLSAALDDEYHGVRIDLPNFGYSDRLPYETSLHTAAGMAETVAGVLRDRFDGPVLVVGVGFGGSVGAEIAISYPEQISGLVFVDSDIWSRPATPWISLETLPWLGKAATYTWETGGRFALGSWSPHCDEGGWCPSADQVAQRSFMITIEGTTEAMYRFLRTKEAALAPANLGDIAIPTAYVWSTDGPIDRSTVDRMTEALPGIEIVDSTTFQAHLEDPAAVNQAIAAVAG